MESNAMLLGASTSLPTITKVEERNSWESRTYFAAGVKLTPENCTEVYVAWPNGAQQLLGIDWREESHSYSDHGHRSTVRSQVPYICAELHGLAMPIKLSRLSILR